jgi:fused signal recognition particle receptor
VFKRLREGLFGLPEDERDDVPEEALEKAPADQRGVTATPPAEAEKGEADLAAGAQPTSVSVEPPSPHSEPVVEAQAPSGSVEEEGLAARPGEVVLETRSHGEDDVSPAGGFFRNPFRFSLGRTRQLFGRVNAALETDAAISEELWDELEETLISADVGVQTTEKLMSTLRERVAAEHLEHASQLRAALKEELELLLGEPEPLVFSTTTTITVYLMVGVNGVGKTTSIAKLANLLKRQKHSVLLAAGDTFRAAAIEQLRTWGERVGVPVVSHQNGADPGAVVYDAMQAAQARGADVLVVDTAGRLHTKFNLMEELKKIMRVLQKYDPEAPHEVLLVMDATTGQNGFLQAKQFVQDAGVSAVILTKLDGTARGGIVFAIASELGVPIKFVGTGERVSDLAPFDPTEFVDALFERD